MYASLRRATQATRRYAGALLVCGLLPSLAAAQGTADLTTGASARVLRPLQVIMTGNGNPNNLMVPGTSKADEAAFDVYGDVGTNIRVSFVFPAALAITGAGSESLPLGGLSVVYLASSAADGDGDISYTTASYVPVVNTPQLMTLQAASFSSPANQYLRFLYTANAAVDQKAGAYAGTVVVSVAYTEI